MGTEQVQALIDFSRMSLGIYGNWLKMKSEGGTADNGDSSSSSGQWTTYFAVMRDFNIFLFDHEHFPSSLEEVVSGEYSALSLAHIEGVKQCATNPTELYLEVTGSKRNQQIKFGCESVAACKQWIAEMNYQIHIVSDLLTNQALRVECADQKRNIWIPVAPPYNVSNAHNTSNAVNVSLNAASKRHRSKSARKLFTQSGPVI